MRGWPASPPDHTETTRAAYLAATTVRTRRMVDPDEAWSLAPHRLHQKETSRDFTTHTVAPGPPGLRLAQRRDALLELSGKSGSGARF
jgi:hypothetical protein